jgi:hypothetical protein
MINSEVFFFLAWIVHNIIQTVPLILLIINYPEYPGQRKYRIEATGGQLVATLAATQ